MIVRNTLLLALTSVTLVCFAQQNDSQVSGTGAPSRTAPARSTHIPLGIQPDKVFRVGPGDVLNINVWDEPQLTTKAVVRPDGYISVPLIGEVLVSGLSPDQIQQLIAEQLTRIVKHPRVSVVMLEIRSRVVYIAGEVQNPGAYSVDDQINVLQLIARSGGVTKYAHKKSIFVLRPNVHRKFKVNYDHLLKGRSIEENVALLPGDTVVVP